MVKMDWILQGNTNRFDIDDYIARYSYVYWSATRYLKHFSLNDSVFLWRARTNPGVVALGKLKELPTERYMVRHPEALGDDFWVAEDDEPTNIKVGIEISEVRLTIQERMISRNTVKNHPVLRNSSIIRQRQGSVFKLKTEEANILLRLWSGIDNIDESDPEGVNEGQVNLRQHKMRERSSKIVQLKKEHFKSEHGRLFCEICKFDFAKNYPINLGSDFIEVHHLSPISTLETQVRTTLNDLMVVCPNCHRMIHRTNDTHKNLNMLREHFR
jgi:hypothetical protein